MPVVTADLNGSSAGTPPGKNDHVRAKRDVVKGWSPGAVRRHTRWLQSIEPDALAEGMRGYAVTLTMRDCPPDAETFHALRRAWIKRLERSGAVRIHWVIEWQRRGVPHIHAAVYWPEDHPRAEDGEVLSWFYWVSVARPYGARDISQHVNEIDGPLGWLKYLSKHAARGARHYQRTGHPEGWERTGRLWGHTGEWPTFPALKFSIDTPGFYRYRRMARAWRIADARADLARARQRGDEHLMSVARARITYARQMLRCSDRRLSSVRGVSDWIPLDTTAGIMSVLAEQGHRVEQVDE